MRSFKTYFLTTVLAMLAPVAFAQSPGPIFDAALVTLGSKAVSVSPNVAADDLNQALLIRAIRSGVEFDVGTTTARYVSFYTDAHVTLDTTVVGTVGNACGATPGKLQLADTGCNTLGELADAINSSPNWRAVVLDGRRADLTEVGSASALLTLTYTDARALAGVAVTWNTSVKLETLRALVPAGFRSMVRYLNPTSFALVAEPFNGYRTLLYMLNQTSTFTTATSLEVHGLHPVQVTGAKSGSETDNTYFIELTAATTVAKTFDFTDGFALVGGQDEKLLVRVTGASVFASEKLSGYAVFVEYPR